jgi:hypothetical protein
MHDNLRKHTQIDSTHAKRANTSKLRDNIINLTTRAHRLGDALQITATKYNPDTTQYSNVPQLNQTIGELFPEDNKK